jgi:Outer membrane receptor proteins, mostly Fe transport
MRMKKTILYAWVSMSSIYLTQAQNNEDTLRNIELPAATIKELKHSLLDDNKPKMIELKMIQRLNQGQDIPQLLNMQSSVLAQSDAGTGIGYTGLRIRGSDITRINVTMNGVPVNDPESQATFFVNTPDLLSSARQIEITKGVGSSKNGVANFGGAINLNTLDVDDEKPSLQYMTDAGTFNTFRNTLKVSSGLVNNKWVATVRLSSIESDGYVERSTSNLKSIQATGKYLLDEHTQLVFNFLKGREKTGQAWNGVPQDSLKTNRRFNGLGIKPDGTFYDNQTDNYGQDYYQLFFDKKLNSSFSFGTTLFYTRGKGYYEEYKMQQNYADYYLPYPIKGQDTLFNTDLIRQLWLDNHFVGGRLYGHYKSRLLDAALYINMNHYNGLHYGDVIWSEYAIPNKYRWYHLDAFKTDANIYGMLDYRVNKQLTLFADLQYRQVRYVLNGFRNNPDLRHDLHFRFFNPKAKITYRTERHLISMMAGIAQKEPNRDDIEAGATNLPKPEKLFNTELNYIYTPTKQIGFYTTLFGMFYKDQLVLSGKINDVGAYTRTNIERSYRAGVEQEVIWKPTSRIIELALNFSLSENRILNFTEYIDNYDEGNQIVNQYEKTHIAFSPACIAGGRVSYFPLHKNHQHLFQELSIDLIPKYVSKQYLDNTSNENKIIPAYSQTDIVIQCPIKLRSVHLTPRIGIYNVLNQQIVTNGYTFSYIYQQQLMTQIIFILWQEDASC